MQTHVFIIRALTHLHAGSGDANYGAVDKLVQRDPTTKLPTIHSSSIKGALREHFEEVIGWKHEQHPKKAADKVEHIFGSAVGDSENAKQGHYHFFSADLLALAIPDESENSGDTFHRISSEKTIGHFIEKAELMGGFIKNGGKVLFDKETGPGGINLGIQNKLQETLKEKAENLPVIARNQLENGISNNLWYEEIVPRETIFGWIVCSDDNYEKDFIDLLDDKIIQIGANATVGYGFCHFKKIN